MAAVERRDRDRSETQPLTSRTLQNIATINAIKEYRCMVLFPPIIWKGDRYGKTYRAMWEYPSSYKTPLQFAHSAQDAEK